MPLDTLRRARIPVSTVGIGGREIVSSHGVPMTADLTLSEAMAKEAPEMIVLPGGMGGVRSIAASADALDMLRAAARRGTFLAAICAGPTVFGQLGLLKGRKAVCYPGMEGELTGALPQPGQHVVRDGNFITSQAAGSGFDFGLALVEALRGPAQADEVRRAICYHE